MEVRGNRLNEGRWVVGEAGGNHRDMVCGVGRWGGGSKEQWDGWDERLIQSTLICQILSWRCSGNHSQMGKVCCHIQR